MRSREGGARAGSAQCRHPKSDVPSPADELKWVTHVAVFRSPATELTACYASQSSAGRSAPSEGHGLVEPVVLIPKSCLLVLRNRPELVMSHEGNSQKLGHIHIGLKYTR